MTPFAHAIAQQLGAPVPGAPFLRTIEICRKNSRVQWQPEEGTLLANILDYLRNNKTGSVSQIAEALRIEPTGTLYSPIQHLRKRGAIEAVRKVGSRIIWRATQ